MRNSMTTYERHQTILRLLQERGSVKGIELAKILQVSEGTIRNDLTALEQQGELERIHGGAIAKDNPNVYIPILTDKAQINAIAKKQIARWAAEMVDNGDTILLDASTTVLHMASFLKNHKHLTIITHQLEAARLLARNQTNTVILIGGILREDGLAVTGLVGETLIPEIQIAKAFVSSEGFSFVGGLTEFDVQEVRFKQQLLSQAHNIIALVDSSKFGKQAAASFASVDEIAHIITDEQISPEDIQRVRDTLVPLTICGDNTAQTLHPYNRDLEHFRIGFANLSEEISFPVDVRRGLERAVKNASNIDLIVADNALDGETAIKVAEHLIAQDIDLVIEYQIDEQAGHLIMDRFKQYNIPVIAVDIPLVGATYFGVDNYRSGYMAGTALGEWIKMNWQGEVDDVIVLEEPRAGSITGARIQGQLNGLQDVIGDIQSDQFIYVNSGNTGDISYSRMVNTVQQLSPSARVAVICFNDDVAIGALRAIVEFQREGNSVIVGQGADSHVRDEIRKKHSPIIGSTAFAPEQYGEKIVELALKILRKESVPPAVYIAHEFITSENIDRYYPE